MLDTDGLSPGSATSALAQLLATHWQRSERAAFPPGSHALHRAAVFTIWPEMPAKADPARHRIWAYCDALSYAPGDLVRAYGQWADHSVLIPDLGDIWKLDTIADMRRTLGLDCPQQRLGPATQRG